MVRSGRIGQYLGVGLGLALSLGACSALPDQARPWKEGPAITLPHVVATLDSIELKLVEQQPQLALALNCTGPGEYRDVKMAVQVNQTTSSGSLDNIQCTGPNMPLADRLALRTDNPAQVGDVVTISIEASFVQGNLRGEKQSVLYMMGTDGQLRQGAGSVWR